MVDDTTQARLPGETLPPLPLPRFPAEQVALTIPLIDDAGLALAIVPACDPLSLPKARRALRSPQLRRATLEETRAALPDHDPAVLPPFGAPLGLRAVADRRLLTYNHVLWAADGGATTRLVDAGHLLTTGGALAADICDRTHHREEWS